MIRRYERDETVFKHNKTVLHPFKGTVKEKANNYFELEIEVPMNENISNGDIIVTPTPRGEQPFRAYRHIKTLKGKKVFARHLSYDLLKNFLIDVRASNALVQDALQLILNNAESPHLFTGSSNMTNRETAYYIRKNPIEAIMGAENSILNRWGGCLIRDNYNLRIVQSGLDRNFEIRLGKNLIGIEDNSDESQVVTRLYPTIVTNQVVHALPEKFIDSPFLNAYEVPMISEVRIALEDGQEELPLEELYQIMRDYCNNLYLVDNIDKPISNFIVDFVQLKNTSALSDGFLNLMEQIDLYDYATVRVAAIDIDVKLQMIEYSYNILTKKYDNIELGQKPVSSSYQTANVIQHLSNELAKSNKGFSALWDLAINIVSGNKGGYQITRKNANNEPYETLWMDTKDINTASNVLRINKSGIAGSISGINGPYDVAITTDGWVVGKRILTESLAAITANLGTVTAGRIQDADNESYWDLNTGEIVLNVKSMKILTKDVATVEDLEGIKAWIIEIYSTNGNVFKNDNIHTTLVARVYKGTEDITDTLDASRFKWTRVSADTDSDIQWNAANFGGTKNITLTPDDVQNRATFNVTITES